jgi:hypothetical protein
VSKFALFMAAISIACFSPCSLSCFGVFSARFSNSFLMFSDSWSRLLSLSLCCSGYGELSSFSGCAAGLVSSLLGVQWTSVILCLASSSSVSTLP